MKESPRCPSCGLALPASRMAGFCPACTWKGLFEAEEEPKAGSKTLPAAGSLEELLMRVPGYDVLGEIARGGMGIVYRARQWQPARTVALKMLLPHQFGSAQMAERFRLEVRALSELEHPAILPVHQVGEHEGLPFFTMKLATGGTLAQRREQFAGKWRTIAELMATLADAVQFAHEHGVLHRDLKPGNVLFDDADRPFVSDFGLAKLADSDTHLTRSVDFLGTPHYVAPEIAAASARQATTASDVYSLGAILYELLAGRPPFEADGMPALLRKIAEEEPLRPSALKPVERRSDGQGDAVSKSGPPPTVPRDLEVICLKCLARQPAHRYASARELQEDLRRWLEGRPILGRPVSRVERLGRWAQRNPVVAGLSAALALALAGGGLALWRSDWQARSALRATRQAQRESQDHLRDALLAQAQGLGAAHGMGQRWQALDALVRAARIRPSLELRNEASATLARPDLREVIRFPASFGEAGSAVVFTSELESYVTSELTGGFALRSTKDQTILANFPEPPGKPARWFVLSADDRQVAALMNDYSMEIWKFGATAPRLRWQGSIQQPPIAEFHPNGVALAGFVPGEGLFLQSRDGGEHVSLPTTNGRAIYVQFDPAGERLAVVRDPGGVEMWRCTGTPMLQWFQPIQNTVPWLAWSPDGRKLVAAADDGRGLRIFSAADGQTELVYSRHLLYPRQFEFDPSGRVIASMGQDWALRLWDARTGQDLVTGVGRHRVMRFSRDGRRLSTAPTDHDLAIMEVAPELVFREFRGTPGEPAAGGGLASSADGRFLLTVQPQLRLYDTGRGEEVGILNLPFATAKQAFFENDGSAVFYSCLGKGIYRRDFAGFTNALDGSVSVRWGEEKQVARHPNAIIWNSIEAGETWVRHGTDGVEIWPHRDPGQARKLELRAALKSLATSQNARWAAAPNVAGRGVTVWDCETGRVVTNLPARVPEQVWFSPDSRWLVASVAGGYDTWETGSWKRGARSEARLDSGDPGEVTFSANSRLIAVRQEREIFRLMSFPDCRELVTLKPPLVVPVRSSCLSPDGTRLWLLAPGYRLFEWNLAGLRAELAKLDLNWGQEAERVNR